MENHRIASLLKASTTFLSTPFEQAFHGQKWVEATAAHPEIPIGCVAAYLLFCYFGRKYMEDKKAFNLRMPLALWNASLCLFSFIGMCRTVPFLFSKILTQDYEETVCGYPDDWGVNTTGFWVMAFIYSKIPELVDTVFIVLRKKPLIFLHWYHHVTVLLFCWNSYATMAASGLYFVAMNYTVHALMYGYYCLQALGKVPRSFPTILITIAQIAQMFVGTGVCVSTWYYTLYGTASGKSCHNDYSNLIAGALMYGSYLYLFVDFFVRRYFGPKKPSKKVL